MKLSASLVKTYKMCRRKYELKYLEELEPIAKTQALQDGSDYHSGIENWYVNGNLALDVENNPKISAMVSAYTIFVNQYQELAPSNVQYAEKWFEYHFSDSNHTVVGRIDAITKDGIPIEHKTVSGDIDEEYVYTLQWDEQIPTYMLANGINEMIYTVIKKPTIRQKQNETAEDFFVRCMKWYYEDTEKKFRVIKVTRSLAELEEHRKNLIVIADEIESCKHFYRNPNACNCYNRRCEYSQVCLNYNPQLDYVEYKKKEKLKENGLF